MRADHVEAQYNQWHEVSLPFVLLSLIGSAMSASTTITRHARSGARGESQPLLPCSLNTLPTEVLRLHLENKHLTTTGPRAALVRQLRGHLRSAGADGGPHTLSSDGSDPSGSEQLDNPEDRAAPAPSSEGGKSSPANLDHSGQGRSQDFSKGGADPTRPHATV